MPFWQRDSRGYMVSVSLHMIQEVNALASRSIYCSGYFSLYS
uniref:Uncharacterized protein n=1 Tax=Arundo donax TaxID=35708 RepID=A0A0A8ZAC4_ARUDO